eukprot:Em0013g207a
MVLMDLPVGLDSVSMFPWQSTCWGSEAKQTLSQLGSHLASQLHCSKSYAITRLYGKLSITLVRANSTALLASFTLPRFVPMVLALSHNTTSASAIQLYKSSIPPSETINAEALLLTPVSQKSSSSKLEDRPPLQESLGGLYLDPSQFWVAIKGWFGLEVLAAHCALRLLLTHLAIHAVACKRGGDVVSRHINYVMSLQSVQMEMGSTVTFNHSPTH